MSSDSDGVCVAVCDAPAGDEDFVCAPAAAPEGHAGDASRQRGRRWSHPTEDTFLCWLLVDASLASPESLRCIRVATGLEALVDSPGRQACVGVGRCRWVLSEASPDSLSKHTAVSGPLPDKGGRWLGFLRYEVVDLYCFPDVAILQGSQMERATTTLSEAYADFHLSDEFGTVAEAMTEQELNTGLVSPLHVMSALLLGDLVIARSVRFTQQLRYTGAVELYPRKYIIKYHWQRWSRGVREEHGDAEQEAVETAGTSHPFLKHPLKRGRMPDHETLKKPTKRTKYDPVRLIRSVDFQHYLRDEDQFSKALDKAKKVDEDPSDDDVQPRDASKDASKSTRQRARHRLDVLNMLLERREFEEWLAADVLESIHVHADASPVVGVELQGQLLDLCFKDGDVKQRVLPGAELPYGMTGAVSKACTLLWGMFLTLGPRKEQLRTALSLVASFTTDNGTEVGLLKLPDILDAFYLWMGGMPIGDLESHVVQGSRLFQEAIRVIGFGHTCGSIMSSVANSYKYWPEIDGQIKIAGSFFP